MNSRASLPLAEVTRLTGELSRKCEPEGRLSRENFLDDQAAPGSVLAEYGSVLAVSGSWEQRGLPTCPLRSVPCHLLPAVSVTCKWISQCRFW